MSLGDRLKCILSERNITQVDFAGALGVSANYINLLVNGKKSNISETLAKLIEETYGYSATWVITGLGDKDPTPKISKVKREFIKKIQKMPDDEVMALLAYADSLARTKSIFSKRSYTPD